MPGTDLALLYLIITTTLQGRNDYYAIYLMFINNINVL